jgi:hypothetical protein
MFGIPLGRRGSFMTLPRGSPLVVIDFLLQLRQVR